MGYGGGEFHSWLPLANYEWMSRYKKEKKMERNKYCVNGILMTHEFPQNLLPAALKMKTLESLSQMLVVFICNQNQFFFMLLRGGT